MPAMRTAHPAIGRTSCDGGVSRMGATLLRFPISCSVFLTILLASTSPGSAATFTVTDFGDSGASGQLRTLITQVASGDTIVIPAGTITPFPLTRLNRRDTPQAA